MANPPNPQRPDLEDLVAFLEGRGSEAMRVLVLKRLDEDPDYLATMNDLVPMLREAGLIPAGGIAPASPEPAESEPKPKVIGDPSRFRRRTGLITIAAALVPIAVSMWLWTGSARLPYRLMPPKLDSAQLQAWNSILATETWVDTSNITRGSEGSSSGEISSLPLIGAQIFDLEVAVRAQDRALAQKRLQVLQSSLGNKAESTYDGVVLSEKDSPDWARVEKEMADAYYWLAKPPVFGQEGMKQIERGTCLRAAWLAEKAQNPDYFRSWGDTCSGVVDTSTWQDEVQELQKQLFPPDEEDL